MTEQKEVKSKNKSLSLIVGILIGLIVGYFIGQKGLISLSNKHIQETSIEEVSLQDVVTIVDYNQDYPRGSAHISMRNNLNEEITSINGRMIYYDMEGNMLDYYDFKENISIDAGMVKCFDIRGFYGNGEYVYYQNNPASKQKKYKYEFQLLSYKVR